MHTRATDWSDEDVETLQALVEQGATDREIAETLGRSKNSITLKISRLKQGPKRRVGRPRKDEPSGSIHTAAQPIRAIDQLEMQEAALKQRISALEQQVADKFIKPNERVPVESRALPQATAADLWQRAEDDCAQRIQHTRDRSQFSVQLDEPCIGLVFVSDQHIAPGTPVDFRKMRQDAELIASTPGLYAILGGDCVDNHIKHRGAVLAARSQPSDQWTLFEHYLGIFAPKIICLTAGNHDLWTNQFAGVDHLGWIMERNRVCYSTGEARIALSVGEQQYKVAIRHQYRYNSSFNQGHTVKQWFRMGEEPFDIGCVGHHHEASVEAFRAYGKMCWACRPGSYQITSAYAQQYGFNDSEPTCPTFLLFRESRRIVGFWDLRDAVVTLKAERA